MSEIVDKYVQYIKLDDPRYQSVYASKLYGTFFSVHAKFNTVTQSEPAGDYFVESIEFEVINYNGVLDIGIVDIQGKPDVSGLITDTGGDDVDYIKIFDLRVRAFAPGQMEKKPEYSLAEPLLINAWFNKGDMLYFQRTLEKLHDSGEAMDEDKGIFDDEFFFREGIAPYTEYLPRDPKPRQDLTPRTKNHILAGSGPICSESKCWVV